MSFLIRCPHCGDRSVYEFRFGGEVKRRPSPDAPEEDWHQYINMQNNRAGEQTEWWFHRAGCLQWLHALRNTVSNKVLRTYFPDGERP